MILLCRLRYHRSVLAASVYDRFGNRFQQNGVFASSLTFSGNNNRIDGASYDASGNLLNDGSGGHSFTYDAENRLISVTSTNGTSTYSYDAFGHRVERTGYNASSCAPGIADYVFDLQDHWILQLNSGGGACGDEIYVGSRHVGSNRGNLTWSHNDWLGNERLRITYPSVNNRAYDVKCQNLPFGDDLGPCPIAGGGDNNGSPIHFTGKERDVESNLDDFGARFYTSSMGRFMSPDWAERPTAVPYMVAGDPQSLNLYGYVRNDPVSRIDAGGHISEQAICQDMATMCNPFAQDQQKQQPQKTEEQSQQNQPQNTNCLSAGAQGPCPDSPQGEGQGAGGGGGSAFGQTFNEELEEHRVDASIPIGPLKAINLPAWRAVSVDMTEVLSGHTAQGVRAIQSAKAGIGKDLFPSNWSEAKIEAAIRQAYRYASKAGASQGDSVFLQGKGGGLTIQMWVNTATKTIESAWPKW